METRSPKTLLLIPVYNHSRTLRTVAEQGLAAGFPVLVVDDGSTDRSLETILGLQVERCRFPVNRGKGAAIRAGAEWAQARGYDAVITLDADGQHDPAEGWRLRDAAATSWPAIVVGARDMEAGRAPRSSIFGRDFSNFWVKIECGRSLPDTQSGFRLYPAAWVAKGRFLTVRYAFEVEVLVRAVWAGLPVLSAPVSVRYPPAGEGVSHFDRFWDNLRLTGLHTWLVARSLLPWPHRRIFGAANRFGVAAACRLLSDEPATAGELAAAVWVGIFIGALPIIPFGIATIIYVNHRLRLSKLAGVGASNVCCAPFVPFLCIETGHFLLYGRFWTAFNRQTLVAELPHRLWEWLLGAIVVGPLLGFLGAAVAYILVRSLRAR